MVTKTCWYSGIILNTRAVDLKVWQACGRLPANAHTREHIIPQSSALYRHIPKARAAENLRPAAYVVNTTVGSLPIPLKLACRSRLMAYMDGRTNYQPGDGKAFKAIIRQEAEICMVEGMGVLQNPIVVRDTQIRLWSPENPFRTITPEMLARREQIQHRLHAETLAYVVGWFGFDPEVASRLIAIDLKIG